MDSTSVFTMNSGLDSLADRALRAAARFWFIVVIIGQWAFAFYVAAYYGGSAVRGDMDMWNKVFPRGYIAGDTGPNFIVALHLFLAVVIAVGGPLQLIPQIRAMAPAFHRWNGRVYLTAAVGSSVAGLAMFFTRGSTGDLSLHIALGLNSLLVIVCAALTLRYALARKFHLHRRWALRLFLVVSGVWFFRVGLMLWLVLNQGPVGFDPVTFTGPFLTVLAFAQYLLPLALLEIYFCTQDYAASLGRFIMACSLALLTVAMAVGVSAVIMLMWLPRI